MISSELSPAAAQAPDSGVERGWSATWPRKISRLLARRLVSRSAQLAGPTAAASITFDDAPESAARVGAPALERMGVRGTFYVSAGQCGTTDEHWRVASRADVRALASAGHEIGCHTASHVNVQSLSRDGLARECARNAALLAEICGAERLESFAYPFGDVGLRQKRWLERRFSSCRTIYERVNVGRVDLGNVGAIGLFDRTLTPTAVERLVAQAAADRAWLVFYTHDVSPTPTFMGTSPALLDATVRILADYGVPCLTMAAALRHHRVA
jgi:peptidoglycan/xylan/chitin deacetylase (PgdA/CDA1 family)